MGKTAGMPRTAEPKIIRAKKLKKDGSLDGKVVRRIAAALRNGETVLLPVDGVYTLACASRAELEKRHAPARSGGVVYLVSSFKMLADIASFSKADYDFLNRIWPGEVNVTVRPCGDVSGASSCAARFPHNRFIVQVVELAECPIASLCAPGERESVLFHEQDLLAEYRRSADLVVIVEELCKRHPMPTVIDICNGELRIVTEGKVPVDEIKSLYFLGKDDEAVY